MAEGNSPLTGSTDGRRRGRGVRCRVSAPDADISLDLAAVFNTVYRRGQYERSIDYLVPLDLPLSPKDRAWAQKRARQGGDAGTG